MGVVTWEAIASYKERKTGERKEVNMEIVLTFVVCFIAQIMLLLMKTSKMSKKRKKRKRQKQEPLMARLFGGLYYARLVAKAGRQ